MAKHLKPSEVQLGRGGWEERGDIGDWKIPSDLARCLEDFGPGAPYASGRNRNPGLGEEIRNWKCRPRIMIILLSVNVHCLADARQKKKNLSVYRHF